MTINKDTWQKLADKYNSKAKWADALLMLNAEDHDDIISALIELDPSDLAERVQRDKVTFDYAKGETVDLAQIKFNDPFTDRITAAQETADTALTVAKEAKQLAEEVKARSGDARNVYLRFDSPSGLDAKDTARLVNRALGNSSYGG